MKWRMSDYGVVLEFATSTSLEIAETVNSAWVGVAITLAIFVAKGFLIRDKLGDSAGKMGVKLWSARVSLVIKMVFRVPGRSSCSHG
jgi:hypothetical protein